MGQQGIGSLQFKLPSGGGGQKYEAREYYNPAFEQEAYSVAMDKARREERSFELAERRERRAQEREDRKNEQMDHLDETLGKISTKLRRPDSMKFQKHYEDIMGDPDVHRAMVTKEGRTAVMGLLKDFHDQHQNYVDSWNQIGKNYGWEGDLHSLPTSADGTINWNKTLKEHFNPALERRQREEAMKFAMSQQQAGQYGYGIVKMPDGTTKLVKNEDMSGAFGKKPEASTPLPSTEPSATTERPPLDSFQTQ
jgi:hypothetical protein